MVSDMGEYEKYMRCVSMIRCCNTKSQLIVAIKWINLFVRRFGGFSSRYALELAAIRGAMMFKLGVFSEDFEKQEW